jgi:hypothetical protein
MLPQFPLPKASIEDAQLLPCPTAVKITRTGVIAVVIAHSKADPNRYLVTWWDTHFWTVARRWMDRESFAVIERETLLAEGAA